MLKAIKMPWYIVHQGNNDRIVEVVRFKTDDSKSVFICIELYKSHSPDCMNGYAGGYYHLIVTAFSPNNSTKLRNLIANKNNTVIYKSENGEPQSGSGRNWPSHLNDSPFAPIVQHDYGNVNQKSSDLWDEDLDGYIPYQGTAKLKGETVDKWLADYASWSIRRPATGHPHLVQFV